MPSTITDLVDLIARETRKLVIKLVRGEECERWLGEILALIHGDGGHHLQEHGVEVSTQVAIERVNMLRADLDKAKHAERKVSAAYLRIRQLLGTLYGSKKDGVDRFELTEQAIRDLQAQAARAKEK